MGNSQKNTAVNKIAINYTALLVILSRRQLVLMGQVGVFLGQVGIVNGNYLKVALCGAERQADVART